MVSESLHPNNDVFPSFKTLSLMVLCGDLASTEMLVWTLSPNCAKCQENKATTNRVTSCWTKEKNLLPLIELLDRFPARLWFLWSHSSCGQTSRQQLPSGRWMPCGGLLTDCWLPCDKGKLTWKQLFNRRGRKLSRPARGRPVTRTTICCLVRWLLLEDKASDPCLVCIYVFRRKGPSVAALE